MYNACSRGVAQSARGRRFKSFRPDRKDPGRFPRVFLILVLARSPDLSRVMTEGLYLYLGYSINWLSDQRSGNGRPEGLVTRSVRRPARTDVDLTVKCLTRPVTATKWMGVRLPVRTKKLRIGNIIVKPYQQ